MVVLYFVQWGQGRVWRRDQRDSIASVSFSLVSIFWGFGYLGVVVFRLAVCRLPFIPGSGYRLSGLSGSVSSGSSSSRLECVFLLEISHRLGLLPLKSMAIRASARFRLDPSSPPFPWIFCSVRHPTTWDSPQPHCCIMHHDLFPPVYLHIPTDARDGIDGFQDDIWLARG